MVGRSADGRGNSATPCPGPHVSWLLVGLGLALTAPMAALLGPDTWFISVTPASIEAVSASVATRDRIVAGRDGTSQGAANPAAATCASAKAGAEAH